MDSRSMSLWRCFDPRSTCLVSCSREASKPSRVRGFMVVRVIADSDADTVVMFAKVFRAAPGLHQDLGSLRVGPRSELDTFI